MYCAVRNLKVQTANKANYGTLIRLALEMSRTKQ